MLPKKNLELFRSLNNKLLHISINMARYYPNEPLWSSFRAAGKKENGKGTTMAFRQNEGLAARCCAISQC